LKRGFVDLPDGQVHYRYDGRGEPVLLLHQSPRSSDEFLEVIPLLAKKFRVLAPDTIGYGDSYRPKWSVSIHKYATSMASFLDEVGIKYVSVVGHHTGAVVAMEMVASYPDRILRLVLSNCPYVDRAKRLKFRNRPPIDEFEIGEDGSHLIDLWNRRVSFYPKHRPDLLNRFVIDVLKAGPVAEEGHKAVAKYRMEERIKLVKCPTLVICGTDDEYAYPDMQKLAHNLEQHASTTIRGGRVPMPNQMPVEFARAVSKFLSGI